MWPWFFALIVLVFVLMVGCVAFVVTRVRAPIEASNAFVAHLDEGELDAAYDSLCSETRSAVPREQFKQDVALDGEITGYTLTSASAATGTLTLVSGTIEVDETPRNISFRLTREGDTWRVCTYDLLDRSQLEVSPLDG